MKVTLLILLFLFFATLSAAEVYKWVDEHGVVHFSDDFSRVPEKYRPRIEKTGIDEEKAPEADQERDAAQKKKPEVYRDRLGRGEDYWKGRVEEWKKKLQSYQEQLETLRQKYNELTEKFNSSRSTAQRAIIRNDREEVKGQMDELKARIEEAKEMLERKIPEEAALYKAKPEWVKP